ncbi:MAG TPA: VOC family protein [Xanthomonadales bacterium]|nr:VOC family protein [Xanthomonadales bacterium]
MPFTRFLSLALLAICLQFHPVQSAAQDDFLSPSWSSVTVGVADLDQALEFWVGTLGFSQLASAEGDDPELATLWRLLPEDIKRQALLGMPGSTQGRLHLVEFSEPGPAVREGTKAYDAGPQSLVVYAQDLPARVKEMQEAGFTFFSAEPYEVSQADGLQLSEIRLGIHDEVSLILRELHGAELVTNARGFSGIMALVNVVEFAQAERDFLSQQMGLGLLAERSIEGIELEYLMGLPSGALLETSSWGAATDVPGQLQLDDFRHASPGANLYPVAVPTQLGILHVTYAATAIEVLQQKLHAGGYNFNDREFREVIYGSGRFIRFRTPAGMNIEAFQ